MGTDPKPTPDDEIYDLADEPATPLMPGLPPGARRPLAALPASGTAPSSNGATGRLPALSYASAKTASASAASALADAVEIEGSPVKDFYLPIGLIVFGVIANYARIAKDAESLAGFAQAALVLGGYVVWNTVIMVVGLVIGARVADVGFGRVGQAVLKVMALTLAPLGLGALVTIIIGGLSGELLGLLVSFPAYWWFFSYLFDLDFRETTICVVIIMLLKLVAFFVLRTALG